MPLQIALLTETKEIEYDQNLQGNSEQQEE